MDHNEVLPCGPVIPVKMKPVPMKEPSVIPNLMNFTVNLKDYVLFPKLEAVCNLDLIRWLMKDIEMTEQWKAIYNKMTQDIFAKYAAACKAMWENSVSVQESRHHKECCKKKPKHRGRSYYL